MSDKKITAYAVEDPTSGVKSLGIDSGGVTKLFNISGAAAQDEDHYVTDGDNSTITGVKTFASFPITPSESPDADYEVANKKYADDLFSGGAGFVKTSTAQTIAGVKTFTDGIVSDVTGEITSSKRRFTPGRIDSQELTSGALSTSGWYTIAEISPTNGRGSIGDFKVYFGNSSAECSVSFVDSGNAKTHENTTIKYNKYGFAYSRTGNAIKGFRLAKSDSVLTAGAKVQVNLGTTTTTLRLGVQLKGMIAETGEGITLVTPYLDNTPTLPDGVTVGTFLEAGAELSFSSPSAYMRNNISAYKETSDDALYITVDWPEIPKQGTSITIDDFSSFKFRDLNAYVSTQSLGSYTISNFVIVGKTLTFKLNQTGIASGITDYCQLFPFIYGTTAKLTITG